MLYNSLIEATNPEEKIMQVGYSFANKKGNVKFVVVFLEKYEEFWNGIIIEDGNFVRGETYQEAKERIDYMISTGNYQWDVVDYPEGQGAFYREGKPYWNFYHDGVIL